jgi:predicted GIY-YIG superfamily endonuclease
MEVVYSIKKNKKILYIGRTNNFYRRIEEHTRCIVNKNGPKRYQKVFNK